MVNVFKIVIKDAARAGVAVAHAIAALPDLLKRAVIDLFKVTAEMFGADAVKQALHLAETRLNQIAVEKGTPVAELALTDVEHTQLFAWVKGELIATGVVPALPDAHTLAGLAITWALKGISLVEHKIEGGSVQ